MKKHVGIGNYVGGGILYKLIVEDINGELSYWFTELQYRFYRKDRYGKRIQATP